MRKPYHMRCELEQSRTEGGSTNSGPDLPFTMQTRLSSRVRSTNKYEFVVDRIDLENTAKELVGLEEITVSRYEWITELDID